MTQIKLVVFDMAGTTVKDHNEVERCFVEAAHKTNLPFAKEDILAMMGWSKIKVFETLWTKASPESAKNTIKKLANQSFLAFREILENHYRTSPVEPTDGCIEMFDFLHSNHIKIALTTGFYREVTNIILSRLEWDKNLDENYLGKNNSIIDLSISSDEVAHGRPEPDMIKKAMSITGINDPEQVINIGDTPSDLLSGKKAGCIYSLGVCNGTHTREQLQSIPNDGLLNNIGELANYLN